jgi:hypothetical protein
MYAKTFSLPVSGLICVPGSPASPPEPPLTVEHPCVLQGLPSTKGDGVPFASRIWVPPAAGGKYKIPSSEALRLLIWS